MPTALVVDDDRMFRAIMKRHITNLGFVVLEKESGVGVKDIILAETPEFCLIDIVMKDKEGIETIIELAKCDNRPKIIAVSSQDFYLDAASELGADGILLKPVTPEHLKNKLQEIGVLMPKA